MSSSSLLSAVFCLLLLPASQPSYNVEIEKWRVEREAALKADDGWLTLVGLFWLKEGRNSVGTQADSNILLPKGSAPASVGVFDLQKGSITFHALPEAAVALNGRPVTRAPLKTDLSGPPDVLRVRDLTMFVIQRGDRYGVRLKDKNSTARKAFTGLKYFPVSERYRVRAKLVPYNPPKRIAVPNMLGQVDQETSPGYVVFTLNGHEYRLEPINSGDMLFFIFKDLTSGRETYPSGRFLFTDLPKDGEVVLDFNKAVNPPCAFTPFATCPLPPKQNQLPIRIEAGELRYGH